MASGTALPAELVGAVLDNADIHQLVVVSHVCALWRSAAHAHPLFWRDVTLDQVSVGAVSFFEARLGSARGESGIAVSIHIETDTVDGRSLLNSIALPAVERSLGRTVRLSLRLPEHTLAEVPDFLGRPAPMLILLAWSAAKGRTYHLVVRTAERLFNGFAPELRTLELTNVRMLNSNRPCALFHSIESLHLVCNSSVHLPGLLSHFPSLRHLDIYAESCAQNHRNTLSISQPLLSLRLRLYYGGYDDAFNCFSDLGKITHMSCWLDTSFSQQPVAAFLRVFGALPIKLSFLDNCAGRSQHDLGVMFSCPNASREHTRTLYMEKSETEMPGCREYIQSHVLSPVILAHVSHLRIPARQTPLVSLIEELPVCEVLEIAIDDAGIPPHIDNQVLRLPALRTVVLSACGPAPVSVSSNDIFALLHPIVGKDLASLAIRQENVHIVGDTTSLTATFAHPSS